MATLESIAARVWRRKLTAELAESSFRDSQGELIDAMVGVDAKSVIISLDADTDVTGTLVQPERIVIDEDALRSLGEDVFDACYPERVIPRQVIPEQRVRELDTNALTNLIANGTISNSDAAKIISYEPAKKPHVKWSVQTTKRVAARKLARTPSRVAKAKAR